jgi:hypothetical protein
MEEKLKKKCVLNRCRNFETAGLNCPYVVFYVVAESKIWISDFDKSVCRELRKNSLLYTVYTRYPVLFE